MKHPSVHTAGDIPSPVPLTATDVFCVTRSTRREATQLGRGGILPRDSHPLLRLKQLKVAGGALDTAAVVSAVRPDTSGFLPLRGALLAGFLALRLLTEFIYLQVSPRTPKGVGTIAVALMWGTLRRLKVRKDGGRVVAATELQDRASKAYGIIDTSIQCSYIDRRPG